MTKEHIIYGIEPVVPISRNSTGIYLYHHFRQNPEKVALSNPVRNFSIKYKDVVKNSCLLALKLKQYASNENDVIGLCIDNEPEFLYVILAALYLGRTVTAFNPQYTQYEMNNYISISKPKLVFCTATASKIIGKIKDVKKIVIVGPNTSENDYESFERFISANVDDVEHFQPVTVDVDENVALILYSSGTTGFPKGVCITHKNINSIIAISLDPRYKERYIGDVAVNVEPFFHAGGLFRMLLNLINGKEVVLLRPFNPNIFLKTLQDRKVEVIETVPTVAKFLANSPLVDNYNLNLKYFSSTSAHLPPKEAQKLINRLKLKQLWQIYGMTESTLRLCAPSIGNKFGSCGQLHPYMSSKVIDLKTKKTLGVMQAGELCFKGPQIMKEYKNNKAATKKALDNDGWLHSGDLGYFDNDGYLFIVDRIKDIIKYKEFQVAPAELEFLLMGHPKIFDAAVVGVPDKDAGELPLAFVVKNPDETLTEAEVQEFVANKVSSQKKLRGGVIFLSKLPKTHTGKTIKSMLLSMLKNKL